MRWLRDVGACHQGSGHQVPPRQSRLHERPGPTRPRLDCNVSMYSVEVELHVLLGMQGSSSTNTVFCYGTSWGSVSTSDRRPPSRSVAEVDVRPVAVALIDDVDESECKVRTGDLSAVFRSECDVVADPIATEPLTGDI